MQHPQLRKKMQDGEFLGRYNRMFMLLSLQLLPLLVFAAFIWGEFGYLPWDAVGYAATSCALLCICLDRLVRSDTLAGMRREKLISSHYTPPRW